MDQELKRFRRKLPHWRQAGAYYFITWRLQPGRSKLTESEKTLVADALLHFQDQRYRLLAYVVMDDHVHTVVRPQEAFSLSSILHSWKSFTAHEINKVRSESGAFWQEENYERIIRNERELNAIRRYILDNPARWAEDQENPDCVQ